MDMDTDALGDLAVGDALRMRFPGYGVFTGKVVAFEGSKVDVHWNEDSSSTLLTPAQALKARVAHTQAEPKRSPKKKNGNGWPPRRLGSDGKRRRRASGRKKRVNRKSGRALGVNSRSRRTCALIRSPRSKGRRSLQ